MQPRINEPIAQSAPPEAVADEFQQVANLGGLSVPKTKDGKQVHIISEIDRFPNIKHEIGRLRETTFRGVGEGTSKPLDLDHFDSYYHHIVAWNPSRQEIIGAYRIGLGMEILEKYGAAGFYTSTLFKFSTEFTETYLPRGVELGRSFIQPNYQRELRSLDSLWQGITCFLDQALKQYPQIRYLFGPVSISAELEEKLIHMLVFFYSMHYPGNEFPHFSPKLVKGHNNYDVPFNRVNEFKNIFANDYKENFLVLKRQFTNGNLPILFKRYSRLCKPDCTGFFAFHEDPHFNTVCAFTMLDLIGVRKKSQEKYKVWLRDRIQQYEHDLAASMIA